MLTFEFYYYNNNAHKRYNIYPFCSYLLLVYTIIIGTSISKYFEQVCYTMTAAKSYLLIFIPIFKSFLF